MSATATSSTAAKRMALSRDQRQVLEAVYAMEKLPDASLRDRLSKYLDLSTRQIQVWFQNRRQRAKAGNGGHSPKRTVLCTPGQIMDALFDFTDADAAAHGGGGGGALSAALAGFGGGAFPPRSEKRDPNHSAAGSSGGSSIHSGSCCLAAAPAACAAALPGLPMARSESTLTQGST